MSKTINIKVGDKNLTDLLTEKELEIKNASLRDMLCSYSYELLSGKTKGDMLNRKGVHVIHDDLENSFKELDVFLAHIDGAFSSWSINQTPIQELEENEKLDSYHVNSFKISGNDENISVVLKGTKGVSLGTMNVETPKIKLNGGYLYILELTERLRVTTQEVELYMDGKSAPKFEQASMDFPEDEEVDFENAKMN